MVLYIMSSFIYRIIIVLLLLYIYRNVAVLPVAGAAAGGRDSERLRARSADTTVYTFFAAQSPEQYIVVIRRITTTL